MDRAILYCLTILLVVLMLSIAWYQTAKFTKASSCDRCIQEVAHHCKQLWSDNDYGECVKKACTGACG